MQIDQYFALNTHHPAMSGAQGLQPYVQVLRLADGWSVELTGDSYLASEQQLSTDRERALQAFGWTQPEEGKNWAFTALTAEEASERVFQGLARVFAVAHPTLLTVGNRGSFQEEIPPPDVSPLVASTDESVDQVTDLPLPQTIEALILETRDDLISATWSYLKGWIDERIRPDADGVFAFQVQDILVLVEPSASAEPWLHLSALVANEIPVSEDLLRYLNHVTASLTAIQMFAAEQAVFVRMDILGSPFIAETLGVAIQGLATVSAAHRDEILDRFGGRSPFDPQLGGYL